MWLLRRVTRRAGQTAPTPSGSSCNNAVKQRQHAGRGTVGKTVVVGIKDRKTKHVRATVVSNTDADTLQGFVTDSTMPDAMVYTDGEAGYVGLPKHDVVRHSVGEYVRDMAYTNGMESFWSMLKRAHMGTFHKLRPKHLDRYVQEFTGKHNMRNSGTLAQMRHTVAGLVGRNLPVPEPCS